MAFSDGVPSGMSSTPSSVRFRLVPYDQELGATRHGAHIDGGRERVRTGLFMPTRSARRFNPVIASFAARLKAAGKPDRVRVIACANS